MVEEMGEEATPTLSYHVRRPAELNRPILFPLRKNKLRPQRLLPRGRSACKLLGKPESLT